MKNFLKQARNTSLFFCVMVTLNSCNQIADEIMDCALNRGPVLSKKIFEGGYVGEYYSEYVRAEVKNDPRDNDYDYFFEIYGTVPPGIEVVVEYRKVTFQGIPTEVGDYEITVYVYVEGPEIWDDETESWDDNLCYHSDSSIYTIKIHEK